MTLRVVVVEEKIPDCKGPGISFIPSSPRRSSLEALLVNPT